MSETLVPPQTRPHVAVWFEIPAHDLDRATRFYETVLETKLQASEMGPLRMAVFPYDKPNVSGALVQGPNYRPGGDGPVIYVNCDGKLDAALERVAAAGGRLAGPKVTLPPGMGAFAHVIDTEGNRVGLHSAA